jgi:hypothetical protein
MTRNTRLHAAILQRINRIKHLNSVRDDLLTHERRLREHRLHAATQIVRSTIDELTELAQHDRATIGTLITEAPELLAQPLVGVEWNNTTNRFEPVDLPRVT